MANSFSSKGRALFPRRRSREAALAVGHGHQTFECGIRVKHGVVGGESRRWRFRRSAVDPLISDRVIELNHGSKVTLRLIAVADSLHQTEPPRSRPGYLVFSAVERDSAARIEISVPAAELHRFGLELP